MSCYWYFSSAQWIEMGTKLNKTLCLVWFKTTGSHHNSIYLHQLMWGNCVIWSVSQKCAVYQLYLCLPHTSEAGRLGGRFTKLMGGPEGEFPAPWFANRGLVPLSFPCNRGSGLWSLPSPPVRGRIKCTDCTVCVLVKARLPSLWRLGTRKEHRGPRCGRETRIKLLTYGFFVGAFHHHLGLWKGRQ